MNCMKCGREVALGQAFCKDCLADMAKSPVDPNTPVILPSHTPAASPRRTNLRRTVKPEEQVILLRKLLMVVCLILVAVCLAFAITTWVLLQRLEEAPSTALPGQNYSTAADPIQD